MAILKYDEAPVEKIAENAERRLGHLDNLMIVVIDFDDGPTPEPDPPHSHPHEQTCYVAEGEIIFIMEDEQSRLGPGDVFLVPPDKPHTIQRLTKHVRLVDSFTPLREDFLKG